MSEGVSVVIPTFNRAALLDRTLAALDGQDCAGLDLEVIVVDDGSTDGTADVVAAHPNIRYLRQANAGPAAARNRGWSAARGCVVAFTDDDTVPHSRWVADIADAFAADPDLAAAGGTVRPLTLSFLTRFAQAEQHASHGVGPDGRIKYLVTANCAYRREVLSALGGFDETFPAASGEDTDLTLRAQEAGYRLRLLDGAVVLHDHPSHLRPILRTYRKHGRSRHLVVDRHPSGEWRQGQRDVLTPGHWARRYRAYRREGLGFVPSVGALGLRCVGLISYGVGIAQSNRRSRISTPTQIKVVVACPGADHVARGYERVSRELATVLQTDPGLAVSLAKGSGSPHHDTVLPCLRRDRVLARWISRALSPSVVGDPAPRREGRSHASLLLQVARRRVPVTPYDIEAVTFGISLLCHTVIHSPDVLVLQDVPTARVVRSGLSFMSRRSTKIVFVNGAPWPPPYPFADVVQHVTPITLEEDPGHEWERVLLPLGTSATEPPPADDVAGVREALGILPNDQVLVSLGTMLDSHKRHLHVVQEVAQLPEPRPFLVIAGAPERDQDLIERRAKTLLGDRQRVVHLAPGDVPALLAGADAFVLGSLNEGFGLAYVEALAAGLPTIAHDGPMQRWVLGPLGDYVDMTRPGALSASLEEVLARRDRWAQDAVRRSYVRDRFSWTALRDDYVGLVRRAAGDNR